MIFGNSSSSSVGYICYGVILVVINVGFGTVRKDNVCVLSLILLGISLSCRKANYRMLWRQHCNTTYIMGHASEEKDAKYELICINYVVHYEKTFTGKTTVPIGSVFKLMTPYVGRQNDGRQCPSVSAGVSRPLGFG